MGGCTQKRCVSWLGGRSGVTAQGSGYPSHTRTMPGRREAEWGLRNLDAAFSGGWAHLWRPPPGCAARPESGRSGCRPGRHARLRSRSLDPAENSRNGLSMASFTAPIHRSNKAAQHGADRTLGMSTHSVASLRFPEPNCNFASVCLMTGSTLLGTHRKRNVAPGCCHRRRPRVCCS